MATTITNRVTGLATASNTVRATGLAALDAVWNAWGDSWGDWENGHSAWLFSWKQTVAHSALGLTDRVTGLATANNTNRVTGL